MDAEVLQALAATTAWNSGAQVHRMAGSGSADGVRKVLIRLVGQGIVQAQAQPPAMLYRLNRDHLAAEPIVALARLRQVIIDRIATEVTAWDPPLLHASLFGRLPVVRLTQPVTSTSCSSLQSPSMTALGRAWTRQRHGWPRMCTDGPATARRS